MTRTVQYFPFGAGLHQENAEVLQNPGAPRAIENLVRTKNSRLVPRRDYETIANTGTGSSAAGTGSMTNLRLYDIAEYNGGLVGFGRCDEDSTRSHAHDSTQTIFELIEQPTGNWRRPPTGELAQGTEARLIGRLGRQVESVTICDIAAHDDIVCTVHQNPVSVGGAATVGVHLFKASTDKTIALFGISGAEKPRVVVVNGVFFIGYVVTSTNEIALRSFNPASSNTLATLTSPVGTSASAIRAWDMSASEATATFWIGSCRTGSTTQLRGLNSSGTVTYTAAGPAVLGDAIGVCHKSFSGTERLHVAIRINTTDALDLYTYLPPATTPNDSDLDVEPDPILNQPGLASDMDGTSNAFAFVVNEDGPIADTLIYSRRSGTTHAQTTSGDQRGTVPGSKPRVVNNRWVFSATTEESPGFSTHLIMRVDDKTSEGEIRPVCVLQRFLAHPLDPNHLPNVGYDSVNDKAYFAISTEDTDRQGSLQVLEIRIASSERRQTVQLGDVLYIAGAVVQSYDGRGSSEAGGFLTRPVFTSFVGQGGGTLPSGSAYQAIAVYETRDAKQRRILSAPSNLVEVELGVGETDLAAIVRPPVSMRDQGVVDPVTPQQFQVTPFSSIYRTLNIEDGNGTFHLAVHETAVSMSTREDYATDVGTEDVDLQDEEILYTQGARGALSGPLEMVCPDPCVSIAASADRIVTAALVDETLIQESRPLFPGEQVQWSDALGFYRDIRARTLAAIRLDERRIIFTEDAIFECDGPGLDDNGIGDIGPPRRLPSDVGLYGGRLGWRSMVEISGGIIFQGLRNQLYLLPRGGVTPVPIGFAVEDTLDSYPDIVAAVYLNDDQTVRFCCQNDGGTESIVLLLNVRFMEWFVEGPYAFGVRSAAKAAGRFYLLDSNNTLYRQRESYTPLAFVATAWRSGRMHPFNPGMFGRVFAVWFVGTYRGRCRIRCIVRWDDSATETHDWVDVVDLEDGQEFSYRFEFDQIKCESLTVDFEVTDFQGEATAGIDYNYGALEREPSGVPRQVGPENMS
jgi:hypothetical protein